MLTPVINTNHIVYMNVIHLTQALFLQVENSRASCEGRIKCEQDY